MTTDIMWDIVDLIKDFFRSKSVREFINRRIQAKGKIVLALDGHIEYVATRNGDLFYLSRYLNTAKQVHRDYIFDDIIKNDIVIDIGANIGGFCIPASRMSDHVYAVEPITTDELKKNIALNKRSIEVIDGGLGNGNTIEVKWSNHVKRVKSFTLNQLKAMCGGCDFLKIDCEGHEWTIKPEELEGIRRIEMEVHKIGRPFSEMEEMLTKAGFDYEVTHRKGYIGLWIIHGVNRNIA